MNKRILKLAEQANTRTFINEDGSLTPELHKFAELIIKECLDQCYNRGMNDELYAGQLKAAAYIEEHFGVES